MTVRLLVHVHIKGLEAHGYVQVGRRRRRRGGLVVACRWGCRRRRRGGLVVACWWGVAAAAAVYNCKQTVEDCRVRMNKPVELLVIENSLKAHSNQEEGLDECGVFAIPKYQLSRPQSANEELQSLTMCLQCKTTQIQSMFLPCHHIIQCESCANSTLECPLCSQFITASIRIFVGFSLHKRQLH